jgi:hypothetical protein
MAGCSECLQVFDENSGTCIACGAGAVPVPEETEKKKPSKKKKPVEGK